MTTVDVIGLLLLVPLGETVQFHVNRISTDSS